MNNDNLDETKPDTVTMDFEADYSQTPKRTSIVTWILKKVKGIEEGNKLVF